jgi:hypothetical protein
MPESHEFYKIYLGEYPWARSFLYHNTPYYNHDGWMEEGRFSKIPVKILILDDQYLSSGSSTDCSTNSAIRIKLPAKYLVDEMKLFQKYSDGRFFDNQGDLVAFDPNVFDTNLPNQILIRKDKLYSFLQRKGLAIFWTLLGEKNMIGGSDSPDKWIGRLEVSGAFTLNNKNQIVGRMKSSFKAPSHQK